MVTSERITVILLGLIALSTLYLTYLHLDVARDGGYQSTSVRQADKEGLTLLRTQMDTLYRNGYAHRVLGSVVEAGKVDRLREAPILAELRAQLSDGNQQLQESLDMIDRLNAYIVKLRASGASASSDGVLVNTQEDSGARGVVLPPLTAEWVPAHDALWADMLSHRGCLGYYEGKLQCCDEDTFPVYTTPLERLVFVSNYPYSTERMQMILGGGNLTLIGDSITSQIYDAMKARAISEGFYVHTLAPPEHATGCVAITKSASTHVDRDPLAFYLSLYRADKTEDIDVMIDAAIPTAAPPRRHLNQLHVIVVNIGLHFLHDKREMFTQQVALFARALGAFNKHHGNFGIFRDETPQHFQNRHEEDGKRRDTGISNGGDGDAGRERVKQSQSQMQSQIQMQLRGAASDDHRNMIADLIPGQFEGGYARRDPDSRACAPWAVHELLAPHAQRHHHRVGAEGNQTAQSGTDGDRGPRAIVKPANEEGEGEEEGEREVGEGWGEDSNSAVGVNGLAESHLLPSSRLAAIPLSESERVESPNNMIIDRIASRYGIPVQKTAKYLAQRYDAHLETRDPSKGHLLDCTHWCAPVFDVFEDTLLAMLLQKFAAL